jgi:bifunctional non-homologous end joining protein LigD
MPDPMPEHVVPMLAKLAKLPRDDGSWAYEIKWDGVRAIAYVAGGRARLESRNLNDVTPRYPEVQGLAQALGDTRAVFDGEVVAFDEDGRSSFERLQGRMHLTRGVEARARLVPVVYCIFDLLWVDGEDLMRLPYTARRERLEAMGLDGPAGRVPSYSTRSGEELLAAAAEQRLEGIVCKRLDSPYEPGRRGGTWLKVKNTQRQELVIGGWSSGEGRRAGHLGALHVGFYEDGALRYGGKVGTGFTGKELDRLEGLLAPLQRSTSPFDGQPQPERGTHYVEPELVAEVEFTEWTSQNMLRHPSYKGLRDDKRPTEVVLEKSEEPVIRAPMLRELIGGSEPEGDAVITLDGRPLELTALDEVVYPETGFTKGDAIDYYLRIGPTLLPYLRDVVDVAAIVELVDGGALEMRPSSVARPQAMVFDVRPTAKAGPGDCPELALRLKGLFDQMGLATFPKTDGGGGVEVHVPLNGENGDDDTVSFARAVADTLGRVYPDLAARVRVDWAPDSTLAPYSLAAGARPAVSTPIAWDELRPDALVFEPAQVLQRVAARGDIFAPVLTLAQELPSFD